MHAFFVSVAGAVAGVLKDLLETPRLK